MLGILFIAALIGNIFPVTALPQGRMLLAGIPVLMIVRLYGTRWGALAALLTPLFAQVLGHPPLPELLWVAEAVVVGILLQREIKLLMTAALLFWVLLALPLQYLVYGILLHCPPLELIGLVGMTTLNGIGNAAIASLLLYLLHRGDCLSGPTLSYLDTELNVISGAFFVPILVILALNLSGPRDFFQPGLENELTERGRLIHNRMNVFHAELAGAMADLGVTTVQNKCVETRIALLLQREPRLQRIVLYDADVRQTISRDSSGRTSSGTTRCGASPRARLTDSANCPGPRF